MLLVAVVSFAGLMATIALVRESSVMSEILRFIFISGIIFAIILSFTFMNEEIGTYAPIGLVKKPPSLASGEWVVNIGGNQRDGYQDGIQIPIVVVVLGIVGGYLRYLYKTANLHGDKHKKEENGEIDKNVTRLDLFYQSLEDIALMFLAIRKIRRLRQKKLPLVKSKLMCSHSILNNTFVITISIAIMVIILLKRNKKEIEEVQF